MSVPATTAPTTTYRCRLSQPQLAKVLGPEVWLDDEAQAELGELVVDGLAVIGTPDALRFMAENAEDFLTCHPELSGMVAWSWRAIAQRLHRAADGLPSTPSGR